VVGAGVAFVSSRSSAVFPVGRDMGRSHRQSAVGFTQCASDVLAGCLGGGGAAPLPLRSTLALVQW
jgi:hypothetical protein